MKNSDVLIVRKTVNAPREQVFDIWTKPAHVLNWWGPKGVICTIAEIELEVGGHYRIGNQLPQGDTIIIVGRYEEIIRPQTLTFTWAVEGLYDNHERVSVAFNSCSGGASTEVVVTHERIPNPDMRNEHENGWVGCLNGLEAYIASSS